MARNCLSNASARSRAVALFKQHDEAQLEIQLAVRHDEAQLIAMTTLRGCSRSGCVRINANSLGGAGL